MIDSAWFSPPTQYGLYGDGFYTSEHQTNSIKVLDAHTEYKINKKNTISTHINSKVKTQQMTQSTLRPQKTCDYIFYSNFNNRCPITIIFGIVSSKSMRHRKMVSFPTSPI